MASFYPVVFRPQASTTVRLSGVGPAQFINRSYYDEPQEPRHADELMRQFFGGAATDLSGLVLALPYLLCLWPMSLFLSVSERSRQVAALADGNRLRLTSRATRRHERQTRLRGGLGTTPA